MIDIGEANGAARRASTPPGVMTGPSASGRTWIQHTSGPLADRSKAADVLSVPEAAGREALRRLLAYAQPAVAPGPVAVTATGRVLFYVAPGGSEDLPELLDWLDWGGVQLDMLAYSADSAGSVNGSAFGSAAGDGRDGLPERAVEWLNPQEAEPPELIALLATIATACHRLVVMRGARTGRDIQRPS